MDYITGVFDLMVVTEITISVVINWYNCRRCNCWTIQVML